jgi:hypothetical protein
MLSTPLALLLALQHFHWRCGLVWSAGGTLTPLTAHNVFSTPTCLVGASLVTMSCMQGTWFVSCCDGDTHSASESVEDRWSRTAAVTAGGQTPGGAATNLNGCDVAPAESFLSFSSHAEEAKAPQNTAHRKTPRDRHRVAQPRVISTSEVHPAPHIIMQLCRMHRNLFLHRAGSARHLLSIFAPPATPMSAAASAASVAARATAAGAAAASTTTPAAAPKAALLIIGDEILQGSIADANTPWLAKLLYSRGVDLVRVECIPDSKADIIETVRRLRGRVGDDGFVFSSGGEAGQGLLRAGL